MKTEVTVQQFVDAMEHVRENGFASVDRSSHTPSVEERIISLMLGPFSEIGNVFNALQSRKARKHVEHTVTAVYDALETYLEKRGIDHNQHPDLNTLSLPFEDALRIAEEGARAEQGKGGFMGEAFTIGVTVEAMQHMSGRWMQRINDEAEARERDDRGTSL